VAWAEDGHISIPHDATQGHAEQRSTVHQLSLYGTLSTTVHLMGWMWLALHQTFCVGNSNLLHSFLKRSYWNTFLLIQNLILFNMSFVQFCRNCYNITIGAFIVF
jgi:hypothetical protein